MTKTEALAMAEEYADFSAEALRRRDDYAAQAHAQLATAYATMALAIGDPQPDPPRIGGSWIEPGMEGSIPR